MSVTNMTCCNTVTKLIQMMQPKPLHNRNTNVMIKYCLQYNIIPNLSFITCHIYQSYYNKTANIITCFMYHKISSYNNVYTEYTKVNNMTILLSPRQYS